MCSVSVSLAQSSSGPTPKVLVLQKGNKTPLLLAVRAYHQRQPSTRPQHLEELLIRGEHGEGRTGEGGAELGVGPAVGAALGS